MKPSALASFFLLLFAIATGAAAHEVRPAYLQISEMDGGRFDVLWKVPQRGEMVLGLHVEWPGTCNSIAPPSRQSLGDAVVERRIVDCQSAGLKGQRIGIDGLASTITDALVRIAFADGTTWTQRLTHAMPSLPCHPCTISAATNTMESAMTASTGACGTCTKPKAAKPSVME
jgi:hypothetical protein